MLSGLYDTATLIIFHLLGAKRGDFCFHKDGTRGTVDDNFSQPPVNRNCDPRISCGLGVTSTDECVANAPTMDDIIVRLNKIKLMQSLVCISFKLQYESFWYAYLFKVFDSHFFLKWGIVVIDNTFNKILCFTIWFTESIKVSIFLRRWNHFQEFRQIYSNNKIDHKDTRI